MPHPCDIDLLTSKVVSESRVTGATSVRILDFLGLSVLDLGPMYATARRQTASLLNAPPRGRGIISDENDHIQFTITRDDHKTFEFVEGLHHLTLDKQRVSKIKRVKRQGHKITQRFKKYYLIVVLSLQT